MSDRDTHTGRFIKIEKNSTHIRRCCRRRRHRGQKQTRQEKKI